MAQPKPLAPWWKAAWAVALTFVAGWVDCGGYLWASHVLSANMSGNTVEVAFHFFQGHSQQAMLRVTALASFFTGLLACAFLHDALERRGTRSTASATLALEALLLALATALVAHAAPADIPQLALLVTLGLAMGFQNATLTRIGALSVRTTHVTGTLSQLAESAAAYLFWARDQVIQQHSGLVEVLRASPGHQDLRSVVITFSLWCAFLAGAAAFMGARLLLDRFSLVPPIAVLLTATLFDLFHPMRRQEDAEAAHPN